MSVFLGIKKRGSWLQINFSYHGRVSLHVAGKGGLDDREEVFLHFFVYDVQ